MKFAFCKKTLAFAAFSFLCARFFAIVGIESRMPTESGDYVFYRDCSFHEETYVGALFYNDTTLALRYYSPNVKIGSKNFVTFVTIEQSNNSIEISGEKLLAKITDDDVEKANYLHTFLYKIYDARKAAQGKDFSQTVRQNCNIEEFGGDIAMLFDSYVPIFNLRRVLSATGSPILELVAVGQLESSDDESFSLWTGLPNFETKNDKIFQFKKEPLNLKAETESARAAISEKWAKKADGIWARGDEAILIMAPLAADFFPKEYSPFEFLIKKAITSEKENIVDILSMNVEKNANSLQIEISQLSGTSPVRTVTKVVKIDESNYTMFSLAVAASIFESNREYFSQIVNSFEVKK